MKKLHNIYTTLLEHYGPQNWWPADTQIEIMTGSILVQNTNWTNVTPCIQALTPYLSIEGIQSLSTQELQDIICPSGFSTHKAQTIKTSSTSSTLNPQEISYLRSTESDPRQQTALCSTHTMNHAS